MNLKSNLKDTVTNYLAIILLIVGAVVTFLQAHAGQPINWQQLILFVGAAVIAYFTGKTPAGTTKSVGTVIDQNTPKPVA